MSDLWIGTPPRRAAVLHPSESQWNGNRRVDQATIFQTH